MRNYFLVLRLLFINMLRKRGVQKGSKSLLGLYIFAGITFAMIAISLVVGIYAIAPLFDDPNVLITYLFIVSFFLVIFFSLFSMLSYLYFSKDTEFFLTLPIKPSTIYFAKLTMVYAIELLVVLFLLVPSLIAIGISLSMGIVYYLTMIFAVLIVPAFPLVFTSLLALPLMYVVSYLKNKTALASVIAILLFSGLMAAYMFFMINMQSNASSHTEADYGALIDTFENSFAVWGRIFYPFLCLSRFATVTQGANSLAISMLTNILVFLGSAVALFLAAVLFSNLIYRRSASKNLENRVQKTAQGRDSRRSIIKTLMIQEWKEIFRNPTFAFQCLSYVLLCPVLTFVMMFMLSKTGDEIFGYGYTWLTACALISFFGVVTNIAPQTAITRQGSAFYYSKIFPIDYKTQAKSKILLYTIISSMSIFLGTIASIVFSPVWFMPILSIIYLLVLSYAANCFCMWFDLRNPKLDWATYTEAVKQNKNVITNTFINMMSMMLLIGISFALFAIFSLVFDATVAIVLCFLLLITAAGGLSLLMHNLLFANIERFYTRLP